MATTIITRYEGKCADCGSDIPAGAQARYYGRGNLYGLDCHVQQPSKRAAYYVGRSLSQMYGAVRVERTETPAINGHAPVTSIAPVKPRKRNPAASDAPPAITGNVEYAAKVIAAYIGPPDPATKPIPNIGKGDPAKGPLYPAHLFHHGDHCPPNHRPTSYAYGWEYPNKKTRDPVWRKLRKSEYQRVPLCIEMLTACDGLTAMLQHIGRILCKGDPLGARIQSGVLTGGSNVLAVPVHIPAWVQRVAAFGMALGPCKAEYATEKQAA